MLPLFWTFHDLLHKPITLALCRVELALKIHFIPNTGITLVILCFSLIAKKFSSMRFPKEMEKSI